MQSFQFRPRWIPGLATLLGTALFVHLGQWQDGKAQQRAAEMERHAQRATLGPYRITPELVNAEALQDAPVSVRGEYESDHQFYVDNRQEEGKAGVHVVTPLRIEGSQTRVLVNRGWVGWGQSRGVLPVAQPPSGVVEVSGIAAQPSRKKFFLMPDHEDSNPKLWTRLDLERFARSHAEALQPVVVLQNPRDTNDGLVRNWPAPEDRVGMHRSYALQWYGMAVALILFFCIASLRRKTNG
jgi:surfeit locus 1 family protein